MSLFRVRCLLEKEPVSREMAESHSWSRQDTSPNIYVRLDDPLTFHRQETLGKTKWMTFHFSGIPFIRLATQSEAVG